MAWVFVGVSNVVEVTGTAHTLVTTGIAGTLQAGDLLVACISSRIASTTSVALPASLEWTLVSEQKTSNITASTSGIASGLMAYCVRGTSNPSLTFTHPVAPSVALGRIVAYRNVNTSSPLDTQTSFTTAAVTTAVSGTGLTTTQIEDLIVAMMAGGQEAAWSSFNATSPSGASGAISTAAPTTTWLERADSLTTTGADTSLAIFDAIKLTSGATGNLTATASIGGGHVVIAGAFKIVLSSASLADAWNVVDKTSITLSSSDKTATAATGSGNSATRSTTGQTGGTAGKYYVEFLVNTRVSTGKVGIKSRREELTGANERLFISLFNGDILDQSGATLGNAGSGCVSSDVICLAWDSGAEKIWFRENNGLWNNDAAANPATGVNGLDISAYPNVEYCLYFEGGNVSGDVVTLRTKSAEITHTGPSGFTSWMGEALAAPPVTGTGTPAGQAATASSTGGVSGSIGTGTPAAQAAAVSGSGTVGSAAATGSGALAAGASSVSGAGVSASVATGALSAQAATAAGAGVVASAGSGALIAQAATVAGSGSSVATGSGALQAAAATIAGEGASISAGTGSIVAGSAEVAGTGTAAAGDSGALVAQAATVAGLGVSDSVGTGALQAGAAAATGTGLGDSFGAGTLDAGAATVTAEGVVLEEGAATGTGTLVAGAAALSGEGEVAGEVIEPPIVSVGGGTYRPERPFLVEGVGYGILLQLEGEAHGLVVVTGVGVGNAPRLIGAGTGTVGVAGRSAARLGIIKVAAVGDRGQVGAGAGSLGGIKAAAIGRHDDDDGAAIVAFLLAA